MIGALLRGVRSRVETASGWPSTIVGVRPGGDGRPMAAYKGGGYFAGVYFAGSVNTGVGLEDYDVTVRVGVDLTAVLGDIPTAKMGDWLTGDGGLYAVADAITEGILRGDSVVARLCNQERTGDETRGQFYEDFRTVTCSPARVVPADWIVGRNARTDDPTVMVISLTFGGLKFHKKLSEIPV